MVKPDEKREVVDFLVNEKDISIRQACKQVGLCKSNYLYAPKQRDDKMIIEALNTLIEKHPSIGFWQCYYRLKRHGAEWNHKRVYRVYTNMGLNIRRRAKKRLPARVKQALFQPEESNQVWSLDFMSDSLWDGRRYRILNIIDDFNREVLHVEIDTSINSTRLIRILDHLKQTRGLPKFIRADNGPEFISAKLDQWCKDKDNKVTLVFIQPGKPMQNGFIERFNGSMRREILNAYVFRNLIEVRDYISNWVLDYNNNRPHKALNFLTPKDMVT